MNQALALALAYLLGSIPFALIAGKLHGVDLREAGSGNLGATNVFRTLGRTAGVAVMVLDIAKGAAAVLVAVALTNNPWPLAASALAILGHVFPVWTHFKGGKGVATFLGTLLAATPWVGVLACATWLGMAGLFRISSLAALTAAALSPLYVFATDQSDRKHAFLILSVFMAVLVFIRHHANIARLLKGEEPRIGKKSDARSSESPAAPKTPT